jgi:thioredoxin-related protein
MPFYQKLKESIDAQDAIQMAVVSFETVPIRHGYLHQHAIQVDENEIFQLKKGATRLSGTPTILLVDQNGTVKSSMIGRLPPEKENQLLATLAKS